jgi:hypothetical protein
MGSDLKRQLRLLIAQFDGDLHSYSYKVHHNILPRMVDILYERGFKLRRAENLAQRHVDVIFRAVFEQGLPQETVRLVWSELGHWAWWVRKGHLVLPLDTCWQKYYVPINEVPYDSTRHA